MKKYDVYKDIIYSFKNNTTFFSDSTIKNTINNYLIFNNISKMLIKRIIINNANIDGYDTNRNLFINKNIQSINEHTNEILKEHNYNNDIIDIDAFNKVLALSTIFHELVHVEQKYRKDYLFNSKFIDEQVVNSLIYCEKVDSKTYIDNHDLLLFEYYANIISYMHFEEIYNLYLKDYIEINTIKLFNTFVANDIKFVYCDNYFPILNNAIVTESLDENVIDEIEYLLNNNYDNLKKLKMGLPLDKDILDYVIDISKGKKMTYNLFEDIKNIKTK